MDRDDDRAAELIARNRLLLALAEETRALARDAIERAEDAVRSTMEIRLAWAQVWAARWDDRPSRLTYHSTHYDAFAEVSAQVIDKPI